jgi:hypothetical protein
VALEYPCATTPEAAPSSVFEGRALRTPALVTGVIGKHPATSPEFSHSWHRGRLLGALCSADSIARRVSSHALLTFPYRPSVSACDASNASSRPGLPKVAETAAPSGTFRSREKPTDSGPKAVPGSPA